MEIKPTVMFGSAAQTSKAQQVETKAPVEPCSVFGTPRKKPNTEQIEFQNKPQIVVTPVVTLKDATIRHQIVALESDVQRDNPQLTLEQIKRAVELIKTTNIDIAISDPMFNWGVDLQKQLSRELDDELNCIQKSSLESIKQQIANILSSLNHFNNIVAQTESTSFLVKASNFFNNPKKDFDAKYTALKQLVDNLDKQVSNDLPIVRQSLLNFSKIVNQIKSEAKAYIAAGNFLKTKTTDANLINLFERRVLSLTQTLVVIETGEIQRSTTIKTVEYLLDCVQNVLLNELPMWRTNYISIISSDAINDADYQTKVNKFLESHTKLIQSLGK